MILLSKLKHDQGREPNQQNWGILFPLIILIGWCTFSSILFEFPTFLVYLTKVSPFFEARLTKISPIYLWQLGYYLIDIIVAIPLIIFIKYMLRIRYNTSFSQIGLSLFSSKKYLLYGSLIGIIDATVTTIPILIIWPEYTENLHKRIDEWQTSIILLYSAVTFIVAPIFEEILFRGLFFVAFRKYVNLFWSILISTCLFSILHYDFFPSLILSFFSAVLLCFLYEKTRSLMLCITIHAVGNVFNNLYFILFSFII